MRRSATAQRAARQSAALINEKKEAGGPGPGVLAAPLPPPPAAVVVAAAWLAWARGRSRGRSMASRSCSCSAAALSWRARLHACARVEQLAKRRGWGRRVRRTCGSHLPMASNKTSSCRKANRMPCPALPCPPEQVRPPLSLLLGLHHGREPYQRGVVAGLRVQHRVRKRREVGRCWSGAGQPEASTCMIALAACSALQDAQHRRATAACPIASVMALTMLPMQYARAPCARRTFPLWNQTKLPPLPCRASGSQAAAEP